MKYWQGQVAEFIQTYAILYYKGEMMSCSSSCCSSCCVTLMDPPETLKQCGAENSGYRLCFRIAKPRKFKLYDLFYLKYFNIFLFIFLTFY